MYEVRLSSLAQEAFEEADAPLQRRLDRCFAQLQRDPKRHNNIKALRGPWAGHLRYRVGDYRVIYRIDDTRRLVFVSDIVHRREAYE